MARDSNSRKPDRPFAVIRLYPDRLTAWVREVEFSYRVVIVVIIVVTVLLVYFSSNPGLVIEVVKLLK